MNEKFIKELYKDIITEGIDHYRDSLENNNSKDAIVRCWISALELYEQLSSEQRGKMLDFAEIVMIDTISCVFGILDGISTLGDGKWEFDVKINGVDTEDELQDTFLEYVEDSLYI